MRIFTQIQEATGHKEPIVLVHGSWSSSIMWVDYIKFLVAKGWSIYAPDLRGHGQSEGSVSGARMEDYVSDVRQVIEEYKLESPIIIGHSMGGLVSLMYASQFATKAVVAINPSPTKEVQGAGKKKDYPPEYSPMDVGLPTDPMEVMGVFPDIAPEKLLKMKEMLGMESGVARSERKLGISIPKEKLARPILFVGAELGESVSFGIGIKTAQTMANYYGKEVIEIKGATHPGTLIGKHAMETIQKIENWLEPQNTNVSSK